MRLIYTLVLLLTILPHVAADTPELLNQEERLWLDSLAEPLIVGTETHYQPYNFVDEQGELSGVIGDYVRLLEQRLGIKFAVRTYPSFVEVLDAAKKRHVDIVPLIVAAPERRSYLDFTQPVYATRDRIFTRQDTHAALSIEDLGGMRVGVVDGYVLHANIEANYPDIILVPVATEPDGLLALSLGRIDVYISEIGTSSYYIQREAITNLRVAGEMDNVDWQTFAIRSDWPILNSIIGKGLASISAEEREEIKRRWINLGGVDPRELNLLWKKVAVVVAVVILMFVATLIWTLSLRRLVAKRTMELRQELAERLRAEAAKERLSVAVEQSAEYVLVVDTSAKIEYANLSFLDAYSDGDLRGRSLASLVAATESDTFTEALRVAREKHIWRGEVVLALEGGDPLKVRMTISPIFDHLAQIDGYVATGRDVTKEEQLELRLRQGEKLSALGTLSSGIAHDFNNLLVPILGYSELIRSQSQDDVDPYIDAIVEASERARDLTQRILAFGRGGSGKMVPLDPRFEIEDSMSFLRSLLPTTIELHEDLNDCGTVLGDRTQIQQILLNLCTNASDAMAEHGGILTVNLEPHSVSEHRDAALSELAPGDYALLTVNDTGVGMTDETRAKIFDPYFTDKQLAKGTGLGLATVHGIVLRHGGAVHVSSTPGMGTSFQVFLPTVAVQPTQLQDLTGADMPKGAGETIMVIDDDKLVLIALKTMLRGLGYQVSDWSDPTAAINAFSAEPHKFDAILTDLTMPGVTGIQLTERALAIRPDIPTAIMTGNTSALQSQDRLCLAKPIPLAALAGCLHELLG